MFHAYSLTLELLTMLRPVIAEVRRQDRSLADQLQRAATSVLLNLAEGTGYRDRSRRRSYAIALGSAREVSAALDAAVALGVVEQLPDAVADRLDHVQAVLVRLTR